MFDNLKEFPFLVINNLKEIPLVVSEIYDYTKDLGLKGSALLLVKKTASVAKEIFTAGIYIALLHQHSWLILLSFSIGIASPDYIMEKTSAVVAAIFCTKALPPLDASAKRIEKIWHGVQNKINQLKPVAIAGFIGLMALPVLTVQLVAVFAGLRLGAYIGKNADLTDFVNQPLYA